MYRLLLSIFLITSLFAKEIIAVLDLEQIGLSPQEATILTQRLTTELISLDKYLVVERNNMDKILKEQKFQHSGCTDSECAVEIGQLLNSDFIVIGSVNKFGKTYALDARLIDVGLGKGKLSAKFSMTGEVDALLTIGITSIAKQLCGMQASTTLKQSAQSGISTTTSSYGASLVITSDPPGAEIYIGGNYFDTTPQTLKDFPIGDYDVLLKLEGYEDYTASINLGPRASKNINAKLKGRPSFIQLNGIPLPKDITLKVDGNIKKRINMFIIEVPIGEHIIEVSKDGFSTFIDTIITKVGQLIPIRYELKPFNSDIYFQGNPSIDKVKFEINGTLQSLDNNGRVKIFEGTHNIRVFKKKYLEYLDTVKVNNYQKIYIEYSLEHNAGYLQLNMHPATANVWIDGNIEIISYVAKLNPFTLGQHEIKVKMESYNEYTSTFEIKKGEITTLDINLVESK